MGGSLTKVDGHISLDDRRERTLLFLMPYSSVGSKGGFNNRERTCLGIAIRRRIVYCYAGVSKAESGSHTRPVLVRLCSPTPVPEQYTPSTEQPRFLDSLADLLQEICVQNNQRAFGPIGSQLEL